MTQLLRHGKLQAINLPSRHKGVKLPGDASSSTTMQGTKVPGSRSPAASRGAARHRQRIPFTASKLPRAGSRTDRVSTVAQNKTQPQSCVLLVSENPRAVTLLIADD